MPAFRRIERGDDRRTVTPSRPRNDAALFSAANLDL
jgi:hypothetical protein